MGWIACANSDGILLAYSRRPDGSWRHITTIDAGRGASAGGLGGLAFAPNGTALFAALEGGKILAWDMHSLIHVPDSISLFKEVRRNALYAQRPYTVDSIPPLKDWHFLCCSLCVAKPYTRQCMCGSTSPLDELQTGVDGGYVPLPNLPEEKRPSDGAPAAPDCPNSCPRSPTGHHRRSIGLTICALGPFLRSNGQQTTRPAPTTAPTTSSRTASSTPPSALSDTAPSKCLAS